MSFQPPGPDCPACPRLVAFRERNRGAEPTWHNAPVDSFGDLKARLLIVGLAPGLRGANRTGRPFTGDFAGDLLYAPLPGHGFATGTYVATAKDGFALINCRVTNAVRCVPPENKPLTAEIRSCGPYLLAEIAAMPNLRVILALGRIAHESTVAAHGLVRARYRFGHGARHSLPSGVTLFDSYHCSRYNTNTGRLTEAMFDGVVTEIAAHLTS